MELRCLIVDDNAEFLDAARTVLEREGIEVVGVAKTSTQAITSAASLRPDVVLVDLYLGQENGLELARQLQSADGRASPAVILTSTYDEADLGEIVATSAVVAFLSKSELSGNAIRSALGLVGDQ